LPIELALLAAGQSRCARHMPLGFAVGYQIVDDLNDMQTDAEKKTLRNKPSTSSILQRQPVLHLKRLHERQPPTLLV
jgi:hypothetical protein